VPSPSDESARPGRGLSAVLTPVGHVVLESDEEAEPRVEAAVAERLEAAFAESTAAGLEWLAGEGLELGLPPAFGYWRDLARRYFTARCHRPTTGSAEAAGEAIPAPADLEALAEAAPPMKGLEYLTPEILGRCWSELDALVARRIGGTEGGAAAYLHGLNPLWNAVGRVTFHLAENKRDAERPFAFLATYTHGVSEAGKVRHVPLGRALEEYAGARNRAALGALLQPVQRAAEKVPLARQLLETRALFQPLAWTPREAHALLKCIPTLEECGVMVRIPDWWKSGRATRPQVSVRLGEATSGALGAKGLLDFRIQVALGGEPLTEEEILALLNQSDGLVLLKGRWVEVDRDKLREVLNHWRRVQAAAGPDGLSLLEGLRMLSGFAPEAATAVAAEATELRAAWSEVVAGKGLRELLDRMTRPEASPNSDSDSDSDPGPELAAELRPYQRQGVHWLAFMTELGLGACLADDMGLGKTIQMLALLLVRRRRRSRRGAGTGGEGAVAAAPSLLVVPASLIGNWKAEIRRFAPSLSAVVVHPSEPPPAGVDDTEPAWATAVARADLVITSYTMIAKLAWLRKFDWDLAILDEAQAIKNPGARQSRAVKELRSRCRIALTGTPIENRLGDLWSLFDFLCPGLLGAAREFAQFIRSRKEAGGQAFAPLRRLVRPYILRRLKTDRTIIADLPEKTELIAFCPLARAQAVLYEQSVRELAARLEEPDAEGIRRRGLILAFLTRFKQICNHPSQWLADGAYAPTESGKFQRLRELCEPIAARQEKVLVFTQYREMTEPLARELATAFGRPGLVLHGSTPVKDRKRLVDEFQEAEGPPFFVLSLKAGGTGLNLTAAAHVIHFDRWWNPAVENQATDRAFRIGQKRNVMVHKFTCRGTVEERIHDLITAKSALADDILAGGAEQVLTAMDNKELLRFVALDLQTAAAE
jgi:superfamily II DNA or RNA helicase